MINQDSIQLFFQSIEKARRVLIGTHLNPDGDALGSSLAFSLYLDQLGIKNEVVLHDSVPHNLKFLPGAERIKQEPAHKDFDVAVIFDLNTLNRLGHVEKYFEKIPQLFVIDHHIKCEKLNAELLVDTTAPAAALILTRILLTQEKTLSADIATCLLTGILTDTGGFRWSNTTPESLFLSSKLMEMGGNFKLIADKIYFTKSLFHIKLLTQALENMKLKSNNRLAWTTISQQDYIQIGATDEHTEGIVSELLTIEGVQIAAILRETKPGFVKISIRSREQYDISKVAALFGGGGHRNASGCTFHSTLEDAEEQIIGALKDCLESS